jgi:DNA replication protein DnaC
MITEAMKDGRWPELLEQYGHGPEAMDNVTGDPHGPAAILLKNVLAAIAATPPRYAAAMPATRQVIGWTQEIVADATRNPATGARHVSTGRSLMLLGKTGTGKTHEAYAGLRLLSASGINAPWIALSAADLYGSLRPRPSVDSEGLLQTYLTAKVLFVDDLGAAKPTEWTEEITYRLINYRYERMAPTIFTSNVLAAEMTAALGERIMSRLTQMTERVLLDGPDRRKS